MGAGTGGGAWQRGGQQWEGGEEVFFLKKIYMGREIISYRYMYT